MNVPKLRFKEFDGEWTKYLLNDLVDFHNNQRKPVKETDRISGEFPYYGASGIVGYVNDFIFEGEYLLLSEDGANIVSRNLPIVYKTKGKFWVNNHAHIFTSKSFISQEFLFQYLEKINYIPFNSGTAQPKLNLDSIKSIPLFIPKYEEQEKLSGLLCRIDKKIQLQQQKIDLLQEQKKGFLQKMFPKAGETKPEKRFDGFTEDWEERKLEDIVDKAVDNRGKTPPVETEGEHPLLEVAALGKGYPDYSKVSKYVNQDTYDNWFRAHIQEKDILFSTVGNTGLVSLMDDFKGAAIAQNIVAFRAKDGNIPGFLSTMLQLPENFKKVKRIEMGAVQPSIKVSQLIYIKYAIPSDLEEQQKIGTFFKKLDDTIALHQQKLDLYKEQKKGFMQKMFI